MLPSVAQGTRTSKNAACGFFTAPGGYGMSLWISIIAGVAILVGALRYLDRKA
jgi:hypothetical protein